MAILYPRHFGPPGLGGPQTDTFVATTLERVSLRLVRQAALEILLEARHGVDEAQALAEKLVRRFVEALVPIRDLHDTDIAAAFVGDPSAKSLDEIVLCFPGREAILRHRLAHMMATLGLPLIARIMAELSHAATAIDIHPGARIGPACFIDHGTGVVIGETAVIGRNVRIYQQVTLGAKSFESDADGALVKGLPRHPVVEDDVVIYAGATILGRITIGRGSIIGGGVWVTESIPPGSVVTQAKPRLQLRQDSRS